MATHTILLFTTLGEWIEANAGTLITLASFAVAGLIAFIRLQSQVSHQGSQYDKRIGDMEREMDKHDTDLYNHLRDDTKHVNHLHMRAIEQRLDKTDARMEKMEITMSNGFDKLGDKIDAIKR